MEAYVTAGIPMYICSNAGCYRRIAEEYYTEIAKAKTEEEYLLRFSQVCRKWMRDLSNEDVQRYLLESGVMEAEDIEKIKRFYIENAGPLQNAILSAGMEPGKKYTLVYMNEHGFPVVDNIMFVSVSPCQYAQYTDAVKLTFKRARKRMALGRYFYNCSIAIYEGWHEQKPEDTWQKVRETESVTESMSKYCSFDARFFTDIVERLGKPLVEHRAFKARTSDGKVFA